MALVPIILSGGAGTRLWPLSRETAPKPFMPLPGDGANGDTLLARAFLRAAALPDLAGLVTITNRDYYFHTKDAYASAGAPLPSQVAYLLEPFGRNTGPAIVLGALYAEDTFGPDATLLILPADHLIRERDHAGDDRLGDVIPHPAQPEQQVTQLRAAQQEPGVGGQWPWAGPRMTSWSSTAISGSRELPLIEPGSSDWWRRWGWGELGSSSGWKCPAWHAAPPTGTACWRSVP